MELRRCRCPAASWALSFRATGERRAHIGASGPLFRIEASDRQLQGKKCRRGACRANASAGNGNYRCDAWGFLAAGVAVEGFFLVRPGTDSGSLNAREDYRPGQRINLDAGVRYEAGEKVALLVQANALIRGRDSGAQAEPEDSGGRSLWLSPGVSYAVTKSMQAYAFFQLPLYQFVNGAQLVAERSLVIGVSTRF